MVTAALHEGESGSPLGGVAALLIRPDGYVAWTRPDGGDLTAALRRWFGSENGLGQS
jgi:hypothetical protein